MRVAEDHEMLSVLDRLKPASIQFARESRAPDQSLDIADLAFHHTAAPCLS